MRNSRSRFRRLAVSPTHPEDAEFYEKAKRAATNRMLVFDVAPPHIRDRVNYYPSNDEGIASTALRQWWGQQTDWDFNQYGELVRTYSRWG